MTAVQLVKSAIGKATFGWTKAAFGVGLMLSLVYVLGSQLTDAMKFRFEIEASGIQSVEPVDSYALALYHADGLFRCFKGNENPDNPCEKLADGAYSFQAVVDAIKRNENICGISACDALKRYYECLSWIKKDKSEIADLKLGNLNEILLDTKNWPLLEQQKVIVGYESIDQPNWWAIGAGIGLFLGGVLAVPFTGGASLLAVGALLGGTTAGISLIWYGATAKALVPKVEPIEPKSPTLAVFPVHGGCTGLEFEKAARVYNGYAMNVFSTTPDRLYQIEVKYNG